MTQITNAQLKAVLPAGISLDPSVYPDDGSALLTITHLLDAFLEAQAKVNDTLPNNQRILSLQASENSRTTIVYPPESGINIEVVPRTYKFTAYQKLLAVEAYPIIG